MILSWCALNNYPIFIIGEHELNPSIYPVLKLTECVLKPCALSNCVGSGFLPANPSLHPIANPIRFRCSSCVKHKL